MQHRHRKSLGQHFLIDLVIIDTILAAIQPQTYDTIIEVGPGDGALTQGLTAVHQLHLIELDDRLVQQLSRRYQSQPHIQIIHSDVLKIDISQLGSKTRVVGNLPYYIATPILFHLLQYREHVIDMHLMLQTEVAARLCAHPGTKTYGRLSVMAQYDCSAEPLVDVPPHCFEPPPQVHSTVVKLTPHATRSVQAENHDTFSKVVRAAFSTRRKTISNALQHMIPKHQWSRLPIQPQARAETLSVADFVTLANHVSSQEPV